MRETLKYTVSIPPITKKNSQQIMINRSTGKPFVYPSKQYKDYEARAVWYLQPRPAKPIDYPVNIKCLFYMPTRRKCDLANHLECACDVLVKAGVLADDNSTIVVSMDGSRVLYDNAHPRTEIEIKEV